MTLLAVVVLITCWTLLGVLGSRISLVHFERSYGSGVTPTHILITNMFIGPIGFLASVMVSDNKINDINAAWGVAPVKNVTSTGIISRPRNKCHEVFGLGIKGLPKYNYEETYAGRVTAIEKEYNVSR